jgi:hypothetical protein
MVSSPSLDYDPEDEDQYQYRVPAMTSRPEPLFAPHLNDFNESETVSNPLDKARDLLDGLLDLSCEVPLEEVNDMAKEVGITTSDLLNWAEKSETCHVDWISGHIRCNDEAIEAEDEYDANSN